MEHFLEEESSRRDTKLHTVLTKFSDILNNQGSIPRQKMSAEVIESVLPEKENLPIPVGK